MDKKVKKHLRELDQINSERKKWLMVSAVVVIVILAVIVDWNFIEQYRILWIILSFGFTVSVVWWYWTMRIIRQLINHRIVESSILQELIGEIRHIKTEVRIALTDLKKPK